MTITMKVCLLFIHSIVCNLLACKQTKEREGASNLLVLLFNFFMFTFGRNYSTIYDFNITFLFLNINFVIVKLPFIDRSTNNNENNDNIRNRNNFHWPIMQFVIVSFENQVHYLGVNRK